MQTPPEQLLVQAVGMQSFDRLVRLCDLLMGCADVPGDVVEFGCHEGRTAMLLSSLTPKKIHLYDSFVGLPEASEMDRKINHVAGAMAADFFAVTHRFIESVLAPPVAYKGWFKDVCRFELPDHIAFAHIDCDLHDSILRSLELVYPLLSVGAVCVIDDYNLTDWPGVKVAVDRFMKDRELIVVPRVRGGTALHCWFRKL